MKTWTWPCAAAIFLVAAAGSAQQQPSPERIAAAAEEFEQGRRAYLAKDYAEAATHFENAYRDAPRAETLKLAIRARRDAKQLARAATLAALAQREYTDEATTKYAAETIEAASPDLQRLEVTCSAPCTITADGRLVTQTAATTHRIFVDPGPRELGIGFGQDGSVTKRFEAKKGTTETFSFAPDPSRPKPIEKPTPVETPKTKPFGPVVFFVAAGVTVALGAVTTISAIDTKNNPGAEAVQRECAGQDETCPLYQEGQDKETRTNILLGATIGAVVITGVIGAFFTQWSTPKSALRVTPRGVALAF